MWDDFFKGKKITLMGLGLLGRGVGDAIFFAKHGADLIVTDMKSADALAESLEKLSGFQNVTFALGGHRPQDFQNRDLIVRAANVPPDSPFLAAAHANGIPVEQSVSLFVQLLREYKKSVGRDDERYLVGVTGSKGKTTVTYLLTEMLSRGFPERRVRKGGNIQGVSTLSFLDDLMPDDIFVLELDSWQLQSFGDARMSPQVSVFTTFLPDHMNYYLKAVGGDEEKAMERYFNDKAQIFCFQGEGDVCFVGESVVPWVEKMHAPHAPRMRRPSAPAFEKRSRSLQGEHNGQNIALAASTARALGVAEDTIDEVVATFAGVPGRLQFLSEKDGIAYYNDTTATVPDAALAAIRALGGKKNIVLIMGGADKQVDASVLVRALPDYCKALVLLLGTGTEKIRHLIHDGAFESVTEAENMHDAVIAARQAAKPGDIILLSPGFASFGMFVNEYDRGDQFIQAIQS